MQKTFLTVLFSILFLISSSFSFVIAGVEPSPFQPEINQLGAAENILLSIGHVVIKTIDTASFDADNNSLNGALNKLEATNTRLESVSGFITFIREEVMGVEPSPFLGDLVPALEQVVIVSQQIVSSLEPYLGTGANMNLPQEVIVKLVEIQNSAVGIESYTQSFIKDLNGSLPIDPSITE